MAMRVIFRIYTVVYIYCPAFDSGMKCVFSISTDSMYVEPAIDERTSIRVRNLLQHPCVLTMASQSQQPKTQDGVPLSLDIAINIVNIGKEVSSMTPAPAVFGVVAMLLTTIRDQMANDQDCVDLGVLCASVCDALKRGTDGKKLEDLNESVRDAIRRLEATVEKIRQRIDKVTKRHEIVKFFAASNDKGKIAGWRLELNEILQVFNVCSVRLLLCHCYLPLPQSRVENLRSRWRSKSGGK
ncbi:hypothetical protein EDB86DRAFT_1463631 [Lactarius hatsudake]|nr:hypothetical protein EDB86DRAFT_1463631 [Lactarius hatsudake]